MKRYRSSVVTRLVRAITLRPDATVDPERYPLGYVPLDGSESVDSVWSLVKSGAFVAPLSKIETIHRAHVGIRYLTQSEYPALSSIDVVGLQTRLKELCSRLLIRRDFWVLDDYNDPELNSSFGIQNMYFDNFKWSQVLWRRFQQYVEEYFPVAEHTHLTYDEYLQLLRSFSHFEQGAKLLPLLPKRYRIHPPFGVPALSRIDMEPLLLYSQWLKNFRGPLKLDAALVIRSGCGAAVFATKLNGVPIVRGVDPNPRAVMSCRKDAQRMGRRFDSISFRVGEMFPDKDDGNGVPNSRKYDIIVFYPDQGCYNLFFTNAIGEYAPVLTGFAGTLEHFFEEAGDYLSDSGVIVLCCTNVYSILKPTEPHPIEYEIKVNRRWVLLDYYDMPVRGKGTLSHTPTDHHYRIPMEMRKCMRSELWVLHKMTSIAHFAHIHNIPGAQPPSCVVSHWRNKAIGKLRRAVLKGQVESSGGDWDDYKKRLVHLLQEQSENDEDDKAQAIRMAMDPNYPKELADRARAAIEKNMDTDKAFHNNVAKAFGDISPRERFDACLSCYRF
ncbi:uncharacterized protein TEOVI_000240000 [Trypanosoma equiperdum]|uniref:Methyltransferase n=2 Tax=Trypanozoon TaxID=39700 RepID=Q384U7_TRYB2|nr:hypothetical protein, conserved [Trypanosoma brucei brucei TREU927]EAN79684.1 hypothetical protein, conserved [Trypanosoma brucei brucei TREU927]SCU70825.1 hypothetical protein, conserved [Trypanosoma equiperdum]